jgi:aryl-alcohol dehydrogenase-like predicted oxidoreductase
MFNMKFRMLGGSGLKVSELCLGTMTFGDTPGFGAGRDESRRIFDAYLEAGGNFIDTANIYTGGESERLLADFIAAERARLVVATKFSMTTDPRDPNAGANSRKNLQQSLDASLRRLKTEYVDLYWVHAWDRATPVDEWLRALDDAVRAGKVLYAGLSNAPAWVVAQAQTVATFRGLTPLVALQLHYSLIERNVERELLPCADALQLAVTAWSPLAGGVLTGKYARDPAARSPDTGRLTATPWGKLFLSERNLGVAEAVKRVAERGGATPAQVALRWLMQRRQPAIPILGARTAAQLIEQVGACDRTLDSAALEELDAASRIDAVYPQALLDGAMGRRMVHGERVGDTHGLD